MHPQHPSVTSDLNCFFSRLYLARRFDNTLQTQITTVIHIFDNEDLE